MRLAAPGFLLLLIPLVVALVLALRPAREGRFRFSSLAALGRLPRAIPPRRILVPLRGLALLLFVLALARPQMGKKFTEIESAGVDILLALDTSGSMQALDLRLDGQPVPRVEVVKHVASDFIARRPHDRIGIVVFGDTAYLQCPLTLDHPILDELMKGVKVGVAGDATAIGDAIGIAVNHMKKLTAKSKVIILLTDGQNNSGLLPPLKAAEVAKTLGVKIYTIGVGVEGKAPFLVDTPFGKQVVYQQADLDEPTLQKIAAITGAKFFRAKDTRQLEGIYDEIDHLEKSEVKVKEYGEYHELFAWLALPGLLCLLAEIGLGQTLLRKVP